jgi:superoxide reductase
MEENHYIELIQVIKEGNIIIGKRLKPGDKPEAEFCIPKTDGLKARILCNIHSLWVN